MLTAEVIPIDNKNVVALALQSQGFRIVYIDDYITIGGEKELFEKFFQIKMERLSKDIVSDISPEKVEFYRPVTPPIIPDKFKSLIKKVLFPEPPEFFQK